MRFLCIIYIILAIIISLFCTDLIMMRNYVYNEVGALKEDFNSLMYKNKGNECKKINPISGTTKCEDKKVNKQIDETLKKQLNGVWDEIYNLKKQIKTSACDTGDYKNVQKSQSQMSVKQIPPKRVNYASENLGARITEVNATPVGGKSFWRNLLRLEYSANPPINVLKQSMAPGNCFAYESETAELTIKLSQKIYIDSFQISHISEELSPTEETTSAPKDFELYVFTDCNAQIPILIGNFEFANCPKATEQLFTLTTPTRAEIVRLKFLSNHGHPNYTCIYRIEIYGTLTSRKTQSKSN